MMTTRNVMDDAEVSLPAVLQEFADIVGRDAAMKIAATVGGTRVYIPASVRGQDHWLTNAIGKELAVKLCAQIGAPSGLHVNIPMVDSATTQLRVTITRRVKELDEAGHSSREIARQVGISQRAVHRHRRRNKREASR